MIGSSPSDLERLWWTEFLQKLEFGMSHAGFSNRMLKKKVAGGRLICHGWLGSVLWFYRLPERSNGFFTLGVRQCPLPGH